MSSIVSDTLGEVVLADTPLMSAGLSSIMVTRAITSLNDVLSTGLPSTLVFTHPTVNEVARFISPRITDSIMTGAFHVERDGCQKHRHALANIHFALP